VELARHLLSIDRPERALAELDVLGSAAITPDALLIRVAALHNLDQFDGACAAAEECLARFGPTSQLLAIYGSALRARGEYERSEQRFLDGLAADPQNPLLLCWYARVCLEVGQTAKASKLVDRAERYAPHDDLIAKTRVLIAYADGDDKAAARHGRESLRRSPEDPRALALHGLAASSGGDHASAKRSFRRAAAADPGNAPLVEAARDASTMGHVLMRPLFPSERLGTLPVFLALACAAFGQQFLPDPVRAVLVPILFVYWLYALVTPLVVRRLVRRGRR
jgi:tetratricopeptide (TPR) repeat protein